MKLLVLWSVGVPLCVSLFVALFAVDSTKIFPPTRPSAVQGVMAPVPTNSPIETKSAPLIVGTDTPS